MINRYFISFAVVACLACSKPSSEAASGSPAPSASAPAASPSPAVPTAAAPAPAGAKPPNACTILSAAELDAAFGGKHAPSANQPPQSFPSVSVCQFDNAKDPTATLTVRTEIIDKAGYEATTKTLKGGENVAGVGDAAYFQLMKMGPIGVASFLAYKGKLLVSFTFSAQDAAKAKELGKTVAQKALAKGGG